MVKQLSSKIIETAHVIDNHLVKVDHFLNHQMDPQMIKEISEMFYKYFQHKSITKILTCEASGIGIGLFVAYLFNVPLIFAKKQKEEKEGTFQASVFSYTKLEKAFFTVDHRFLTFEDHVLIVDDFLANGEAIRGLLQICEQSLSTVEGIGIVIEKGFQPGGAWLREKGYDLFSLCIIDEIKDNQIILRDII